MVRVTRVVPMRSTFDRCAPKLHGSNVVLRLVNSAAAHFCDKLFAVAVCCCCLLLLLLLLLLFVVAVAVAVAVCCCCCCCCLLLLLLLLFVVAVAVAVCCCCCCLLLLLLFAVAARSERESQDFSATAFTEARPVSKSLPSMSSIEKNICITFDTNGEGPKITQVISVESPCGWMM